MRDYMLQAADDEGDKIEDYSQWIKANEDEIVEAYAETIDIDDVPDDFIMSRYQREMED